MTAPDVTVSDTPPGCEPGGQWLPLAQHGLSKYEVWSKGGYGRDMRPVRSIDRAVNGRQVKGVLLKVGEGSRERPGGVVRAKGYLRVKVYPDKGTPRPVEVHALIMLANVGPPPDGMQTRHLDSDPWNCRWEPGDEETTKAAGGNLIYGTGPEQRKDQVAAGTAQPPPASFPCVGHARCGAMVASKGRRCQPCMQEAGERAGALLKDGMPLAKVTRKLDNKNEVHVHALARQYGGYKGTLAQARTQRRPPLVRRVLGRFRRSDGK